MKHKFFLSVILVFFCKICLAQNISGLQNKKLNRIDDVGSLIESGLGSLLGGGKIEGTIDSVVISWDAEKTLKAKIYYTGFQNGFFTISTMDAAKRKQGEVVLAKFSQAEASVPMECTLTLDAKVPKGTRIESPYLRIDVAKQANKAGKVIVYGLNKSWKNALDPQNVVINVSMRPVGIATNLKNNEVKDVLPNKKVRFDPILFYVPQSLDKSKMIRTKGGAKSFSLSFNDNATSLPDGISGTWINTDAETRGITKLIITNNNTIQAFGKCSPTDCDWGKTALVDLGGNNYTASFEWSFKKATLVISHANGQLTVNESNTYTSGRDSKNYTYTFRTDVKTLFVNPVIYNLGQVATMPSTGTTANKTPQGPDKNVQINLWNDLTVDDHIDFKRPQDISNINMNVFADKNINSGIYYILPADYHLKWETKTEPEKGYELRILYGSMRGESAESGSNAPVRMSATITAGISSREMKFIKSLLRAARPDFVDLRFLPLRENPQFNFQSILGTQYNIPQNKITVETSTDLSNDIRVAWQTDADTKEFIQTALTSREGIAASVILKPDNEDILDQQIPALINLADVRTLGKINLEPNAWRSRNWRNSTPYPLKLNYLHVLKKENNGTKPIIYSWWLGDATIPPQAQAAFDNSTVPGWLDNVESVVMWVDYSVMECRECDQNIMDAVTDGVVGGRWQQIKFTIPPAVFDSLNAASFLITVRSTQVDPKGGELKEIPVLEVTKDGDKDFSVGPLYVPSGSEMNFEYKVTASTKDGDFYPDDEWIRSDAKEILLGKTKMKEMFRGIIPGIN